MEYEDRFPDGCIFHRLIGQTMTITRTGVTIREILSEKYIKEFNERFAVFRVSRNDTGNDYILKARYELAEADDDEEEVEYWRRLSRKCFENEWKSLHACRQIQGVPRYFMHQGQCDPFPNGYIRAIIMQMVPGRSVVDIYHLLTQDDKLRIRTQLTNTLESMRRRGWEFGEPVSENLLYDTNARQIYLVGFSSTQNEMVRDEEITRNSLSVRAWGTSALGNDE